MHSKIGNNGCVSGLRFGSFNLPLSTKGHDPILWMFSYSVGYIFPSLRRRGKLPSEISLLQIRSSLLVPNNDILQCLESATISRVTYNATLVCEIYDHFVKFYIIYYYVFYNTYSVCLRRCALHKFSVIHSYEELHSLVICP